MRKTKKKKSKMDKPYKDIRSQVVLDKCIIEEHSTARPHYYYKINFQIETTKFVGWEMQKKLDQLRKRFHKQLEKIN